MSGRGRPGGNPDLEKYQFKSPVSESRTAGIYLRITPTDKERLKNVKDWQEKLRQKVKEIIDDSFSKEDKV
ncbi:ssl6082 (plasmid) [Synechocystis sp. PCC 6803]|uniref:Ssl6023 protein n=1 Tax=Synechocystis sp. (strain ATCC 27184 / PCC 6803 / Kazusa) TaxID=1111708 RepID=Q6YRS2_SYNY3|nr:MULTISPECIES: hypothetical protein [unclassified Synechocystis]AGF53732.1 hypothetical protein MYO_3240 [Synechocystis sp. PCC 6803]AGF53791.1 hypothetical protein MYO_3830 [Synechocystis sp. PCC 6803]AVP91761.1 hypothetical protein C7I86_18515 [Synechocystis sp. IPPAS B-1465]MBD2620020.1 hypothetical protein [Synechocystis sp. FACHB-898]MBD2640701.1 hypothetical protein [Synechocystis sp. FACHB-908]